MVADPGYVLDQVRRSSTIFHSNPNLCYFKKVLWYGFTAGTVDACFDAYHLINSLSLLFLTERNNATLMTQSMNIMNIQEGLNLTCTCYL